MVFGGFSLLILLVQTVQFKKKKEIIEKDEVIEFISTLEGYLLLESFCENEFSTENIYLMDVLLSKETNIYTNSGGNINQLEVRQFLNSIYERFIKF